MQPLERLVIEEEEEEEVEDSDSRTAKVTALSPSSLSWADPAVDCEVSDPATGEVLAIAEACWPEGLQPGQAIR